CLKGIANFPNEFYFHKYIINFWLLIENYNEAIESAQEAKGKNFTTDPEFANLDFFDYQIALAYDKKNDLDGALGILQNISSTSSLRLKELVYSMMSKLYFKQKKFDNALNICEQKIHLFSEDVDIEMRKTAVLCNIFLTNYNKAQDEYEYLLLQCPKKVIEPFSSCVKSAIIHTLQNSCPSNSNYDQLSSRLEQHYTKCHDYEIFPAILSIKNNLACSEFQEENSIFQTHWEVIESKLVGLYNIQHLQTAEQFKALLCNILLNQKINRDSTNKGPYSDIVLKFICSDTHLIKCTATPGSQFKSIIRALYNNINNELIEQNHNLLSFKQYLEGRFTFLHQRQLDDAEQGLSESKLPEDVNLCGHQAEEHSFEC
ncbi:MAG: hypothetical protein SFT93_02260, partial [Rickettsiaceae bacterium]|nr:hypothetical protein [Rickettsiaceae bacterium]